MLPSSAVTGSSGSSCVIAQTRCVSDSSTAERRRQRLLVSELSGSPTASDAERLPDMEGTRDGGVAADGATRCGRAPQPPPRPPARAPRGSRAARRPPRQRQAQRRPRATPGRQGLALSLPWRQWGTPGCVRGCPRPRLRKASPRGWGYRRGSLPDTSGAAPRPRRRRQRLPPLRGAGPPRATAPPRPLRRPPTWRAAKNPTRPPSPSPCGCPSARGGRAAARPLPRRAARSMPAPRAPASGRLRGALRPGPAGPTTAALPRWRRPRLPLPRALRPPP